MNPHTITSFALRAVNKIKFVWCRGINGRRAKFLR